MDIQSMQIFAGFLSTAMFMTSNLPMLTKAYRTKNLKSYSLAHIALSNFGNLIYWLYIASLPFGPIWILQAFFTISTGLMLFWYLRYEKGWGRKIVSLRANLDLAADHGQMPVSDQKGPAPNTAYW